MVSEMQNQRYAQRPVYQSISRAGVRLALSGVGAAVCTVAAMASWVPLALGGLAGPRARRPRR